MLYIRCQCHLNPAPAQDTVNNTVWSVLTCHLLLSTTLGLLFVCFKGEETDRKFMGGEKKRKKEEAAMVVTKRKNDKSC